MTFNINDLEYHVHDDTKLKPINLATKLIPSFSVNNSIMCMRGKTLYNVYISYLIPLLTD